MLRAQLPEDWNQCITHWFAEDMHGLGDVRVQQSIDLQVGGDHAVAAPVIPTSAAGTAGAPSTTTTTTTTTPLKIPWHLFKCSLSVDPCAKFHSDDYTQVDCKVLTFELSNRLSRGFLPPEGDECVRFSKMLERVEGEVLQVADALLKPIVDSSEHLYWSRSRPTFSFSCYVFFKPTDEWSNFYMAMNAHTIALCVITVYGQFEHADHTYINRVRCFRAPMSKNGIKTIETIFQKYVLGTEMAHGITSNPANWTVFHMGASQNTSSSGSSRHQQQQGDDEDMLADGMQRCCTIMETCRLQPIAELNTRDVFYKLQRFVYEREKKAYEQLNNEAHAMNSIFDELSADIQCNMKELDANTYVARANERAEVAYQMKQAWNAQRCEIFSNPMQ